MADYRASVGHGINYTNKEHNDSSYRNISLHFQLPFTNSGLLFDFKNT